MPRKDIEMLSTEHWSLLSTRTLGWNEMAGRTQMYLTAMSGTVLALALVAQGTDFGPQFLWFAAGLLPPLLFIGVVTFVRLVYLNREDARWLQGMNRIRHAYVEASPAIERHLVTSPYDDALGIHHSYAAEPPRTQDFHALFTTPGMVSVINAVVAAALVGIGAGALGLSGPVAAALSVATFVGAFIAHWRYQTAVLSRGTGLAPEFPHPGDGLPQANDQSEPRGDRPMPAIDTHVPAAASGMDVFARKPGASAPESPAEKLVILPKRDDREVATHAWADARFAADIMAEHAYFFAILMPEELAARERAEALQFQSSFAALYDRIVAAKLPERSEVNGFVGEVSEAIKPFIEYKARLGEAQTSGDLRSLVWPLFFDHTRHEAERWDRRLNDLARGETEFERAEVVKFWTNIMDEHSRFIAHLLDPDEFELIEKAMSTSNVFRQLGDDSIGGTVGALASEPGTVLDSLSQHPEVDAVMSAVQTILDFKTQAVRDIEAGRIKSIIEPKLADHVRREALKFLNELKRAV